MKKNLHLGLYLLLTFAITISSCVDQKKFIYFQKDANQPNQSDTVNVSKAYIPRIQPGDILAIYVNSLNPAASSFFNPFSGAAGGSDAAGATASIPGAPSVTPSAAPSASGFLVDPDGSIAYPILGAVKVGGLTTTEARDTIKRRLQFYLKEPTVNVRFVNYKISMMGEVMHPSVYVIPNERVTITEAISMAGDLTPFARHDNITVIRDVNGKKEFGQVNINSRDMFSSPYYYLHSGDIVYIEQTKTKAAQNDPTLRILPVILSTFAALVVLVLKFK